MERGGCGRFGMSKEKKGDRGGTEKRRRESFKVLMAFLQLTGRGGGGVIFGR